MKSEVEEFLEYFGDKLPDPEHEPKKFEWFVKVWKFYQSRKV